MHVPCTTCDVNDHPRTGEHPTAQDAAVDLHRAFHAVIREAADKIAVALPRMGYAART